MYYRPGDILGMKSKTSWLTSRIFSPKTDLYHFLIIGHHIMSENEDDYEIYESINSGVRMGRLSWYDGDSYSVFRLNHPDSHVLGLKACNEASNFGRWGYDFLMFPYLAFHLGRVFIKNIICERKIRRISPRELPYWDNHGLICTEFAARVWWKGGVMPIPHGEIPLPASFQQAVIDGKLILIGEHKQHA